MANPPRYSEWLRYLFDHEIEPGLPEWYWRDNAPVFEAAPAEIVELWIATMKNAGADLQGYSDEQVGQGLWYLFSNACSDHSQEVRDKSLPVEKVIEVYDSMRWLYTDLFSRRCTGTLEHLSEKGSPLNAICYMLWDASPLGWPEMDRQAHSIESALFDLLEHALDQPHRACIESALHGLGELQCRYPVQVREMIGSRLSSLAQDEALLQYALRAQQGNVL